MSLILRLIFFQEERIEGDEGDSILERPHLPSLRGDGCPGCDSYATTGYCRHCTAIAYPQHVLVPTVLASQFRRHYYVYNHIISLRDHMCSTV